MLNLKKYRVNAQLRNEHTIGIELYADGDVQLRLKNLKDCIFKFTDITEFEPHKFKAELTSDNFPNGMSLEMYATTREEFISKLNELNEVIDRFTNLEEIEDDE